MNSWCHKILQATAAVGTLRMHAQQTCACARHRAACNLPPPRVQKDRSNESLFFPTTQSLAYLDGSAPGDFGFDPLGLSDPEGAGGFVDPKWLQYGEIMNGRWAMLGAAGCVAPEV